MRWGVHPRGNSEGCENKGVVGKAIRKVMKTKAGLGGKPERSSERREQRAEGENRTGGRALRGPAKREERLGSRFHGLG